MGSNGVLLLQYDLWLRKFQPVVSLCERANTHMNECTLILQFKRKNVNTSKKSSRHSVQIHSRAAGSRQINASNSYQLVHLSAMLLHHYQYTNKPKVIHPSNGVFRVLLKVVPVSVPFSPTDNSLIDKIVGDVELVVERF